MARIEVQPVAVLEHDFEPLAFSLARVDDIGGVIVVKGMVEPPVSLDAEADDRGIIDGFVVDAPSFPEHEAFPLEPGLIDAVGPCFQAVDLCLDPVQPVGNAFYFQFDAVLAAWAVEGARVRQYIGWRTPCQACCQCQNQ